MGGHMHGPNGGLVPEGLIGDRMMISMSRSTRVHGRQTGRANDACTRAVPHSAFGMPACIHACLPWSRWAPLSGGPGARAHACAAPSEVEGGNGMELLDGIPMCYIW